MAVEDHDAHPGPGRLSALRISALSSEMPPRHKREPRPARHKSTTSKIQSKRTSSAGFLFDLQLPELVADPCPEPEATDERGARLATIFLTSAKSLSSRFNVVDALLKNDASETHTHISRATRSRADVVKMVFEFRYLWLERAVNDTEEEVEEHPGVAGVYNPLQVIRNRAVRARLHEQPLSTVFNSVKLACNAFSANNAPGRKWHMTWAVEMSEMFTDATWRRLRWSMLRNPQGELWFPLAPLRPPSLASELTLDRPGKASRMKRRLQDRLWDNDSMHESETSLTTRKEGGIRHNLKERARRLYGSSNGGGNSSDLDMLDGSFSKKSDGASKVKTHRVSREDEAYRFELEVTSSHEDLPDISVRNASESSVPKVNVEQVEDPAYLSSVSNVNFLPLSSPPGQPSRSPNRQSDTSDDVVAADDTKVCIVPPVSNDYLIEQQKLYEVGMLGSYLDKVIYLNSNYLNNICPQIDSLTKSRAEDILRSSLSTLLRSIIRLSENHLPAQEFLYTSFLSETRGLIHLANDNCAVRIDNLLSATDRAYGQINTSLLMDLRKTNDQLDRLHQSLFGGTHVHREDTVFNGGGNYKMLYFLLENSIVVFLRIIWIVASVLQLVLKVLLFLWRILRFFC